jgi:hypothetical protein
MNGPQLVHSALGEQQHLKIALPSLSPEEFEAFPEIVSFLQLLPKAVDWVPVPSTVVYYLERSIFEYVTLKYSKEWDRMRKNGEESSANGLWAQATMPNRLGENPAACGGLKPFSVKLLCLNG